MVDALERVAGTEAVARIRWQIRITHHPAGGHLAGRLKPRVLAAWAFHETRTSTRSSAPTSRAARALSKETLHVRIRLGRAVAALALLVPLRAGAQAPRIVVFDNVSVVPMTRDGVVPNQTVVVTGDRITAVGPAKSTRVPDGATRVDGQGKFLMPGLAEMHGHIPPPRRRANRSQTSCSSTSRPA